MGARVFNVGSDDSAGNTASGKGCGASKCAWIEFPGQKFFCFSVLVAVLRK
jgi:hypothetical protein